LAVVKPGSYRTACGKGHGSGCAPGEPSTLTLERPSINYFEFDGSSSYYWWTTTRRASSEPGSRTSCTSHRIVHDASLSGAASAAHNGRACRTDAGDCLDQSMKEPVA
jgi:hypothetical protein